MTPETLFEIAQLLHQARKLLPEPPPLEDMPLRKLHQRLLSLETEFHNLAAKRQREARTSGPRK